MQAPGIFVSALPELAAGMQIGQNQFDRRHLEFGMRIDRNTPAIIADGARPIDMDVNLDAIAETRQMLINGIVQHLKDAVVQPSLVRVADDMPGRFRTASNPRVYLSSRHHISRWKGRRPMHFRPSNLSHFLVDYRSSKGCS